MNASAAIVAGKSTVTRTAASIWSYLYLVGLCRLASSHSAIAFTVAENSAMGIRTMTRRIIPSAGVFDVNTPHVTTKERKIQSIVRRHALNPNGAGSRVESRPPKDDRSGGAVRGTSGCEGIKSKGAGSGELPWPATLA